MLNIAYDLRYVDDFVTKKICPVLIKYMGKPKAWVIIYINTIEFSSSSYKVFVFRQFITEC